MKYKTINKISSYTIILSFMILLGSINNTFIGEVTATTTAACNSLNVSCQMQPVLNLLDFVPLVINKIPPILIPLIIVMVIATAIIAVAGIPVAVVLLIVSITKNLKIRIGNN